jgi:hypothetical protein
MARLTRDAKILMARMNAFDTFTIAEIAVKVFNGLDPATGQPSAIALTRATRAAAVVVNCKMAKAIKENKKIVAVKSTDNTGGSVQAQFLMNLVISRAHDRRTDFVELPPEQERRVEDRRTDPITVLAPPPPARRRIIRGVVKNPIKS